MSFDFSGYVLRPPQIAPVNAATTAEPTTGVVREARPVPAPSLPSPSFVDARADQYRTAILNAPGTTSPEYLLWAQNTSSLAMIDDPSWWVEQGTGFIPTGDIRVMDLTPPPLVPDEPIPVGYGYFYDGVDHLIVRDNGGRSLGSILALVIVRGDVDDYDDDGWVDEDDPSQGRDGTNPYLTVVLTSSDYNAQTGVVNLTRDTLTAVGETDQILVTLGGGLSDERGDSLYIVRYTYAPAKFWWTKNDRYETRFGWSDTTQRWEPYKGSPPQNVGILQPGTSYTLSPKLKNLPVNSFLPGSSDPDEYAMIRLGTNPGVGSPVEKIRVRPNSEVESDYDFSLDPLSNGVVGQTNGILQFNPDFVALNAGKTIWYTYKGFQADATGVIGKLQAAATEPLFLAPIPGPTDFPLIKLGSRHYLQTTLVETDTDLENAAEPDSGSAIVSLSTGRLRLSRVDILKTDPSIPFFDKNFLGEDVVYDGVALNQVPQPTTKPVLLVDDTGVPVVLGNSAMYVPEGYLLPTEFVSADPYRGLGVSGVLDVPDGTGVNPDNAGTPASVRPGGDTFGDVTTGRIRQVYSGVGDAFIFSRKGTFQTLVVVDRDDDLPSLLKVKKGYIYVSREATLLGSGAYGSRVMMGLKDYRTYGDEYLYFLQSDVTPATYTNVARLYSRNRDIFRFSANQVLYFAIDSTPFTWTALTGQDYYTPEEVADSINMGLTTGRCYALNGRIVLEADDPSTGLVEIGWGGDPADLSGAEVLGFLPGWKAQGGVDNWLPDAGASFGMFRSPLNTDGSNATPDIRSEDRVEDFVLVDPVQAFPFVFMTYPPLQDVAGYDENVFFNLRTVLIEGETVQLIDKRLLHYVDIIHRFGQKKFDWISRGTFESLIENPTSILPFGVTSVVPESLLGAPGIGGGFYVSSDGGSFIQQVLGTDFLLPQDGQSGTALLIETFGGRVTYGSLGSATAGSGTFVDPDAYFSLASPGYRLKVLSGDNQGSYIVQSVTDGMTIEVMPPFAYTSTTPITWELYSGYPMTVYDPTLIVDMVYQDFNHLQSEPFQVRLLSSLGVVAVGNTYKADMQAALSSGRPISLRFGLQGGSATLIALTQTNLGVLVNDSLMIPDTSSARFTSQSFSIRVGTDIVTPLTGVASFSPVLTDGIEYLTVDGTDGAKGLLKFGTNVLADFASAEVWYVETFQPAADLTAGTAEYNPVDGSVSLSAVDLTTYVGERVYFVQQMITEQRRDVALNPILGTFAFNSPVPKGSLVEVSYWVADLEGRKTGDQITEFLPTYVQSETATRQRENVYIFNQAGDTAYQAVEPIVYIGPIQQNFGKVDFIVDYPASLNGAGRLTFVSHTVPDYVPVTVSYAIYEAQGGERSYDASNRPVYRPPFFITANQNRFGLRGDRTAEFVPGQMFRFGEDCFYVKSTSYYAANNVTAVYIFPSTVREVGSRSPGNDVLSVVSVDPITTVVDPDGTSPVATTANPGFMSVIDLSVFPFEPVSRGQKDIVFTGNLTAFATAGHIFEIGGYPYTIASSTLNDDGTRTKITVTSGFQTGFNVAGNPTVKLSYRPIYPPMAQETEGVGAVLPEAGYEVVQFTQASLPGETLRPGIQYELVPDTGVLRGVSLGRTFIDSSLSLLFFSHTKLRTLQPFWQDGVVSFPRYGADFLYGVIPDDENGYLGAQVTATYTFSMPDTFYLRMARLPTFLAETAQEAVQEIKAKQPASGAMLVPAGGANNWENGRRGLLGERKHLTDKDRCARTLLNFYNTTIVTFEQVLETISGGFIGDKDGKFRFFVGYHKPWFTPGYEDAITGNLTVRNVWSNVFIEANPTFDSAVLTTDWITDPRYADLVDGEITGWLPDSDYLDSLIKRQGALVHNEVDDLVMPNTGRKQNVFVPFKVFSRAKGSYRQMWEQHRLSRLFPTTTEVFTMTAPGVGGNPNTGDFGVYTWGREVDGEKVRTTETIIAQLQNPPLGDVTGISSANLKPRYARGRVWGYFPNGIPAAAFGTAITVPCVVALPTPLSEVLIDPDTGYPDIAKFLSQGGDLADALAGDPEFSVPGFKAGDQLQWGKPDGTTYKLITPQDVDVFGQRVYTGVFVADVQFGCVITFQDADGVAITNPNLVLVATAADSGYPLTYLPAEQGDTVYIDAPTGNIEVDPSSSPTYEDIIAMMKQTGVYRDKVDLLVQADGTVVDLTLPSFEDPFPFGIKEMVGQNPPPPMSAIEGKVYFTFDEQNPFRFPALSGEYKDDSGDCQIPYLKSGNTELDRFDELGNLLPAIILTNDDTGEPVYPNEALGSDGSVVAAIGVGFLASEPATLLTEQADVSERTNTGGDGTGDVRPYDILLVQVDGTSPFTTDGAMGIHTVGAVTSDYPNGSLIEPPRFQTYTADFDLTTKTNPSMGMRYKFENYAVYVDPASPVYVPDPQVVVPPPPGIEIREDLVTNEVILEFASVGFPVLFDGFNIGLGGLNDVQFAGAFNVIRIDVYTRPDPNVTLPVPPPALPTGGQFVISFYLQGLWAWTVDYRGVVTGPMGALNTYGFNTTQIRIQPVGSILPWSACPGGSEKNWVMPHILVPGVSRTSLYGMEFTISINTVSNVGAPAPVPIGSGRSDTAWISPDRLTFNEVIDLSQMKPRDYVHPLSLVPMESSLDVQQIRLYDGAAAPVWSDILSYANGGTPFTFLTRSTGLGSWINATAGTVERGSVKVMAFEGWNNTSITTSSDATFSVLPSNSRFEGGVIFSGLGRTESRFNTNLTVDEQTRYDNRVTDIGVYLGNYANIEPGDVLAITQYPDPDLPATIKAGTYLIRHAVEDNDGVGTYREVSPATTAGSNQGWCPFKFPRVLTFDTSSAVLSTSFFLQAPESPVTIGGLPSAFPATGRIYVIRSVPDLTSADAITFGEAVISATYDSLNVAAEFHLTSYQDALGNALSAAAFAALLDKSYPVSGMLYLPMHVGGELGLPEYNCVGYHDNLGNNSIFGVRHLTLSTQNLFTTVLPLTTNAEFHTPTATISDTSAPAVGNVGVTQATVADPFVFVTEQNAVVYANVPALLTINPNSVQWKLLNVPQTSAGWIPAGTNVECLLPGTNLMLESLTGPAEAGFRAQAGIFLEPSFPRSTLNLAWSDPAVVDDGHPLPDPALSPNDEDRELGVRDASRYLTAPPAVADSVSFEVRRIRRFHGEEAGASMLALRYAYEIRRGTVTAYDATNPKQRGLITANVGTNLGYFDDPNVNIHAGDTFRLLDIDGTLLETAEIIGIESPTVLKLASLLENNPVGLSFEVYLRQTPVPHEQSNEQLLDLIMEREVLRTEANWTTDEGGRCDTPNQLIDPTQDFVAHGVKKGDIVLVDPLGAIPQVGGAPVPQEYGQPPLGDEGVFGRTGYLAGQPSELDDNRGYYRVKKVISGVTPYLELDPNSTFAGGPTTADSVTFASGTHEYAVYPTIHKLNEGQMNLRPTHLRNPGTKSYKGTTLSIEPFSYRVIRPSGLFSTEAVDLVLLMRERMLTLLERMRWGKFGTYFIFQRDQHISDLGDFTDPNSGLGVMSNDYIESFLGNYKYTPYLNNRYCMSLLDRRFWILDTRLDSLTTDGDFKMKLSGPGDTPYTAYNDTTVGGGGEVRPVLPDRISQVLDESDRFRDIRYTWLSYRAHKVLGTLTAIRRYDEELPERLAEQKEALLLSETAEDVST